MSEKRVCLLAHLLYPVAVVSAGRGRSRIVLPRAAALRVLAEERIFLAEFDCEHVRNIPTFDWAFPARSIFTIFCHRKVAPKVSAGRKSRGTADGLRLKRYADELAPAFSTAHPRPVLLPAFSQCGVCCALRATMILISFTQF